MLNPPLQKHSLYRLITITSFAGYGQSIRPMSQLDYKLSHYIGYTRANWLYITEQIIPGALSHFCGLTGSPDFAVSPSDSVFETQRWKSAEESKKRAVKRVMMDVIIYHKATGKDHVPGYHGSITAPFIKAIIKGADPPNKRYWGDPRPNDQVGFFFARAVY